MINVKVDEVLYIRTDMNEKIASGHLMRCLTIAEAARENGISVIFILSDEYAKNLILEKGYGVIVLFSEWCNLEKEITSLCKIVTERKNSKLLVDSYFVSKFFLDSLARVTEVIYIDDLNLAAYNVQKLICYSESYENCRRKYEEAYMTKQITTMPLLALGMDYTPLRKCFHNLAPKTINSEIRQILVLSGGSDPYNTVDRILSVLCKYNFTKVYGICGTCSDRYNYLKNKYNTTSNIMILQYVDNIDEYMQQVDLTITAGGTTIYELRACGCPTITYSIADNQTSLLEKYNEIGLMKYLGDARTEKIENYIDKALIEYADFEKRKKISDDMKISGNGVDNLIRFIMK